METKVKAGVAVAAMLVLAAVGVFAIGSMIGGDADPTENTTGAEIPDQQEYQSDANASTQVAAVLSDLYYEDHRQESTATIGASEENADREIQTVTIVRHSAEQLFVGTEVDSEGGVSVEYRYGDSEVGGVAEGAPGQALDVPPDSGWETSEMRYQQASPAPEIYSDAQWSVYQENSSQVVLRVSGNEAYLSAKDSATFDQVSRESYIEIYVDKDTGTIQRIVDHEVGLIEEDDGTIRGPLVFHREATFTFETEELVRPNGLSG